MPGPTATTRLRAEQQEYASNDEAWGGHLNDGVFAIFDEAIAGVVSVAVNANLSLTVENFITDQARQAGLIFTGAGGFTVTAPAVSKIYFVLNTCAADITLKPEGGTGSVIRAGRRAVWVTDGTIGYTFDPTLDQIKPAAAAVNGGGQRYTNAADGVDDNDLATLGQLAPFASDAEQSALEAADSAAAALVSELAAADSLADFMSRYFSQGTDPGAVGAGRLWFDTSANALKIRNSTNTAWLPYAVLAAASQAQAEAGADNSAYMTPLRTKQAIEEQVTPSALVPLLSQVVSSAVATIDFTTGISSAYDEYEFHVINLKPATNADFWLRTSSNAGSSFDSGANNYRYATLRNASYDNTFIGAVSTGATQIYAANNVESAGSGVSGVYRLPRPSDVQNVTVGFSACFSAGGGLVQMHGVGQRLAAAAVDAIRFMFSTGNIASGRINMYGVRKP